MLFGKVVFYQKAWNQEKHANFLEQNLFKKSVRSTIIFFQGNYYNVDLLLFFTKSAEKKIFSDIFGIFKVPFVANFHI